MSKVAGKRLLRSQVPEEQTWNLADLFATDQAWETELQAVAADLTNITQYKGRLSEGVEVFVDCLNAFEEFQIRFLKVAAYARLRLSEDGTNPENQGKYARISALAAKVESELSFLESEIIDLPIEVIDAYLANPEVADFTKFIKDLLDTKPYRLSPETETVLAALGEVLGAPYMIYERTKAADMQFDSIKDYANNELAMSFALYEDLYESSPDTKLRRKATESFTKTLKQYQNTFAGTYGTEVTKQVVLARLRGYPSVTEMLLQPQGVTLEMYHNQLDIIQKELAPHMRRYAKLKKEQLGLDKMLFCDLKAPLDPEYDPPITYQEAAQLILDAFQILGPEYCSFIEEALYNRWVDLADNVGKSTGAFCSSVYGVHSFILMTWTDSMRSAFTLAHELGHAGHFSLAGKYQRLVNQRPSLYMIEAPSTMNELLLGNYILKQSEDVRMRRWVILQYLGTYYHNFVTHLLEAEYQRRVYELAESGKAITASLLNEQKGQVLADFWGDAVEIDEGARLTWMRQPHYYMGLYPYTYSAGLTVATACSQAIQNEGQPAVERWLEFLKVGGKYQPLDHIKIAGLDMSSPEPIRQAVAFVGSLIDELEKSFV